jgi:MFS family permease
MKPVGLALREWQGSVQTTLLPLTDACRYLLATCSFTPLYGRLCNVLGRKGANQTALFFAGLGVLMCGLSTNMETLIVARFVRLNFS